MFVSLQWILVYSTVLFRLAIIEAISEARKKLLAFKWVLYPFKREKVSTLGSVTTLKISNVNKIDYQDISLKTHKNRSLQKIANVNESLFSPCT